MIKYYRPTGSFWHKNFCMKKIVFDVIKNNVLIFESAQKYEEKPNYRNLRQNQIDSQDSHFSQKSWTAKPADGNDDRQ